MWWKNVKEHYGIMHNVHVTEKWICIGSPFVPDLASIDPKTGSVKDHDTFPWFVLGQYPNLAESNPEEVLRLIELPDVFKKSLPVFTHDGPEIIETRCEEYWWPNVTHDGRIMYDNTFFKTKEEAVISAKRDACAGISIWERNIEGQKEQFEKYMESSERHLRESREDLEKLNSDYPDVWPKTVEEYRAK